MREFSDFLKEMATAAELAYSTAMTTMSRSERSKDIGIGGDGTPTMFLDQYIEAPVLDIIESHKMNVLSEEVGWIDRGSAYTVVLDPVDGTANSAAGVPISGFSAAIVEDDIIIESLVTWLGTNYSWRAHCDDTTVQRTTGRTKLSGAALSMLRPRPNTWNTWSFLAQTSERIRILGSSVIEACLVADGAIDAFCDPGGDIHRIVDIAAVSLIVEKSGGALHDAAGRPLNFSPDLTLRWSGIAAATPQLADEIASIIQQHPATTS
jgi:myo-inositol-1(or 4)-monophosphatase